MGSSSSSLHTASSSSLLSVTGNATIADLGWTCTRNWVKVDSPFGTGQPCYSGLHLNYTRPKEHSPMMGWYPKLVLWNGSPGPSNPELPLGERSPLAVYREILDGLGATTNEQGLVLTSPHLMKKGKISEVLKEVRVLDEDVVSIVADYAFIGDITVNFMQTHTTLLYLKVIINDNEWILKCLGNARSDSSSLFDMFVSTVKKQIELAFLVEEDTLLFLKEDGSACLPNEKLFSNRPQMMRGRPFLLESEEGEERKDERVVESITSYVTHQGGWIECDDDNDETKESTEVLFHPQGSKSNSGHLSTAQSELLCSLWSTDALAEHASIASFARFTLQLLSLGAPSELLSRSQQAGKDEVEHARLCFQLASRFGGQSVAPSEFPFPADLQLDQSAARLARAVTLEGCVYETASLFELVECVGCCTDAMTLRALRVMIKDETQHAVLAWKTVKWLLCQQGDAVRKEVTAVFDEAISTKKRGVGDDVESSKCERWLFAYGRLPEDYAEHVRNAAVWNVVRPLAQRLLGQANTELFMGSVSVDILENRVFESLVKEIFVI